MKFKKCLALLLCLATMLTLVSADVYAASYTLTVKSNDGTTTIFTTSVPSGTVVTFTSTGFRLSTDESYIYNGDQDFLGFHTSAGKTVVNYTAGMTYTVTGTWTLYLVEAEKSAHTIVGDPVPGATSYELYEKITDNDLVIREDYPYYLMFKFEEDGKSARYFVLNLKEPKIVVTYVKEGTVSGVTYYKKYFEYDGYRGVGNDFTTAFNACNSADTVSSQYDLLNVPLQGGAYVDSSEYTLLYANFDCNDFSELNITETPFLSKKLMGVSSDLYFDLETLELSLGQHHLMVKAKGEGYYDSDFSNVVEYNHVKKHPVTYQTTNADAVGIDGDEVTSFVYDTRPLSIKIQPTESYLQPDTVTVTMNGTALTSSQYKYYPETGNLIIYSVTGDLTIAAQGIMKVASPVIERNTAEETIKYPLALTFSTVENAVDYSLYVNGTKVNAETTVDGDTVTMKVSGAVFTSGGGMYSVYVIAEPTNGYTASNPSNTLNVTVSVQVEKPVATVASDLRTEDYPFVCKVTKPAHSGNLQAWINGNYCGNVTYETDTNGDWIAYFPTEAFDGSGEYEIYFVALGENINFVESDSSNRLTFTISKLAAPVIRLE